MNEIQEYYLVALIEEAIAYALNHEMRKRSPFLRGEPAIIIEAKNTNNTRDIE